MLTIHLVLSIYVHLTHVRNVIDTDNDNEISGHIWHENYYLYIVLLVKRTVYIRDTRTAGFYF